MYKFDVLVKHVKAISTQEQQRLARVIADNRVMTTATAAAIKRKRDADSDNGDSSRRRSSGWKSKGPKLTIKIPRLTTLPEK